MSPTPERARRQIWRDIHDAIIGTHQDFTEGPIGRAVFLLAVPMILEMVMESLFGIVDVFFVSRLGTDSVATVALTEGMLSIVFGVAIGLSMATTAMVARRTGEKDPHGAAVAAGAADPPRDVVFLVLRVGGGGGEAPPPLRLVGAAAGRLTHAHAPHTT